MKRGYTALEYKSIVRRLRAVRPDLSLTSDFIVGFPGRDGRRLRADDEARRRRALSTARSASSTARVPARPRPSLPDQVPAAVKQARLARLQALLDAQYRAYSEAMVGTRQRVLVTGRAGEGSRASSPARTDNNRVVNFAGDATLIGSYVDVDDHGGAAALAARRARRCRASIRRAVALAARSHASDPVSAVTAYATSSRNVVRRAWPCVVRRFALAGCATAPASSPRRRAARRRRPSRPARPPQRHTRARRRAGASAPGAASRQPPRPAPPRLQRPPPAPPRRASPSPSPKSSRTRRRSPGLFRSLAEGRKGLDRDRAGAVRPALLLHSRT